MPLPGLETPAHARSPAPPAAALAALAAHCQAALAWVDAQGTVRWANPAFEHLAGLTPGDAAGRALDELLQPADPGATSFAQRLGPGGFASADLPCHTPSGRALRLSVSASPVAGGDLAQGFAVSVLDRTALQQAEQDRARLAELLDMAQEFGRIGVWERDLRTLQGRWDRHVFRFWGLGPDAPTPSFEEAARALHPDDRAAEVVQASFRRAGTYSHRFRVLQSDGSVRLVHSQWEVQDGADGRPARAIGIMMDDTEVYELARSASDAHEQFNMAVELARIAIWRHDLKTNRLYYNARAWEVLDLTPRPEGLSLEEVRALIHPDDLPNVLASAQQALATNRPTDMEARYRRRDGSWRYVLNRRAVQRDVNGQPVAFLGVALDITEQVEDARKALELSRRLETAARVAGIGLWTIDVPSGQMEWTSHTLRLFGLEPAAQPHTFAEWLERCVHPEDVARVRHQAIGWLKQGRDLLEVQYRTLWPDGSVHWLVNRSDVDRLSEGRYVFGVTLDVTEQHAAMDALRDAGERSLLAARGVGIGTWELDLKSGEAYWDEQMFVLRGLAPRAEPLSAEERAALVHPDDRALVAQSLQEAMAHNGPATYEFRIRLPSGQWRWLASRSTPVLDEQGRPLRRIGVNWDITDSKNAEAARQEKAMALRESEAKSQFLARMSHELRTPLNAVLGFTQLLISEADRVEPAVLKLRLGHIRAAGQHLLSLINDVLELSSLDTGKVRMALAPVSVPALVHGTVPLVERMAHEYGVRLRLGALHGSVLADPTRLRQVLLNLLSNGIKYNRPGGSVTVSALCEDGARGAEVVLHVADTGRGMTAQQLRHVFEPFNRLGLEREGIEGTGIGLAIVKALVEHMGGRVGVRSEAGSGSVFEVRLPRTPDEAVAAPSLPAQATMQPPEDPSPLPARAPRSGRLLYIEDNPVNVLIVTELVAMRPGLTLDVASDGESGVRHAAELKPDLILVDMQLPDIDGHEVRRRLRADLRTAHIPCIALSANAMPEDIERALQGGFADYWTKPLDFKAFIAAIDVLFGAASA
ncbi:MAG: PAS domain-containing protein [Pseudomonadota bacterium]